MARFPWLVGLMVAVLLGGAVALGADQHARQPSVTFESPSGNIRCLIGQGAGKASARCVTLRPRQAAQVVAGQRARELPFSRVGPLAASDVLPYGQSITHLRFLCRSRKIGVSCVDVRTKRGFRIAREGVFLFPRPKPPRPAPARPAPAPAPAPVRCDPNYTGACVPPYPPDVDCADIGTTVYVRGSDPHRLDGDGDGVACESY